MTSLHRPSLTCIWNTVRSLALPMVWARISLLAQGSSEWFEAVSEELANAFNVSRNSTVEAHLMLGNSFSHGNHLSACVYPVDSKSLSILNDAVTQERSRTQMTYPTRNSASWKAISRARVLIPTPQQRSITRARVLLTLARSSWAIYRGKGECCLALCKRLVRNELVSLRTYLCSHINSTVCLHVNYLERE